MADRDFKYVGLDSRAATTERFARHVSSGKVDFFRTAGIEFVTGRREGPFLWDVTGDSRLIDCHCNGGVYNLGHRHPEVVRTLLASLQELDIGNHHLISEQRAALAAKLAELMPGDINYTVFGVSGGEAIDLAVKVARSYTRRPKVISAQGGYHGHTGLALAAGDEKYRAPFGPLSPGFVQVPFDDFDALENVLDDETAAVLFETIPATYGMPIPDRDFYSRVRELCDRRGALLIVDEVQTGLGRTGKLWGIEHFGVVPDIIVIGKGLSGGLYPMSATCFRDKYEAVFQPDPFIHISTFGGAEVGCPVALKVLEISSNEQFLQSVRETAALFAEGFRVLQARHSEVLVSLRQLGMMMGLEMVHEQCGPLFSKVAFDHGLLSVYANNDPRVAQLLPPLIIDRSLALEIVDRVDHTLQVIETIFRGGR
jgi:acetylornithine/succinyldiaminopimelate/putrescine aminotransferase